MDIQKRHIITYTWFNQHPDSSLFSTHLFSAANADLFLMVRVPYPTLVVDLEVVDFVTAWSASTRTKINRAVRENLAVDRGNYLMPDILRLFSYTAANKGLRGYKPKDLESFRHLECSAIFYDGVMLCGHIWIIDDDSGRALLFVNAANQYTENNDSSLTGRAHYFLLWQDGLFLRDKGVRTMDLMGFDPETKNPSLVGVNQWKAGTHGQRQMLYHYYPIWFYHLRKLRLLFRK